MLQDMLYDAFVEEVIRQLPQYLPSEFKNITIESSNSLRNNNVCRKGLEISSVKEKDKNKKFLNLICFYQHYQDEYSMTDIMCMIAQSVTDICLNDFPVALLEEQYEKAKEYLIVGICNEEANIKQLCNVPCEKRGDLALTYLLWIKTRDYACYTIMVNNTHLKEWGITEETLKRDAWENMKKKFPPVVKSLQEEIISIDLEHREEIVNAMGEAKVPLYIVNNAAHFYGASYMFDMELMSQIAEQFKDDLVILPSSIHEILFMRKKDAPTVEELLCYVEQVNHDHVLPEEVLSNSVYIYNRKTHLFDVISV